MEPLRLSRSNHAALLQKSYRKLTPFPCQLQEVRSCTLSICVFGKRPTFYGLQQREGVIGYDFQERRVLFSAVEN